MSTRPRASMASSTKLVAPAVVETSATSGMAKSPIPSAAALIRSASRPQIATRTPSAARAVATANPSPFDDAATAAVLSDSPRSMPLLDDPWFGPTGSGLDPFEKGEDLGGVGVDPFPQERLPVEAENADGLDPELGPGLRAVEAVGEDGDDLDDGRVIGVVHLVGQVGVRAEHGEHV